MASEGENKQRDDVVSIELPAPAGWVKKKYTLKKGGTPLRHDIVFISPKGEEIKNKKQLDQYLKSHSTASEFDWGSGDTPRRSTRLSERKRKKSSGTEGGEEKNNADSEVDKATEGKEAGYKEVTGTYLPETSDSEKTQTKTEAEVEKVETKTDEPSAVENQNDGNTENLNGNNTVVVDEKVDSGEPIVEAEKPVEQEPTSGS